jgi:hypothetical protein
MVTVEPSPCHPPSPSSAFSHGSPTQRDGHSSNYGFQSSPRRLPGVRTRSSPRPHRLQSDRRTGSLAPRGARPCGYRPSEESIWWPDAGEKRISPGIAEGGQGRWGSKTRARPRALVWMHRERRFSATSQDSGYNLPSHKGLCHGSHFINSSPINLVRSQPAPLTCPP